VRVAGRPCAVLVTRNLFLGETSASADAEYAEAGERWNVRTRALDRSSKLEDPED
jgi:hypothetical protein